MGFFDSPLFWIIVIWWLLSTFLGAKARKRRALQAMAAAEEKAAKQEIPPEEETAAEVPPPQERPFRFQVKDVRAEKQPPPVAPPPPSPPKPAPKPALPLEDLLRGLGLPRDMVPSVMRPEEKAVLPEEPELPTIPEVEPEPEEPEAVIPIHVSPPAAPPVSAGRPFPAGSRLAGLTPLQQAIVLKEILDSPVAFRRDLR